MLARFLSATALAAALLGCGPTGSAYDDPYGPVPGDPGTGGGGIYAPKDGPARREVRGLSRDELRDKERVRERQQERRDRLQDRQSEERKVLEGAGEWDEQDERRQRRERHEQRERFSNERRNVDEKWDRRWDRLGQ